MIYSSIDCDVLIAKYPKAISEAIEYLKSNDFTKMEAGVYEIRGKDIYAQVFDVQTGEISEKRPESHEKYLDIQFLASGSERIGVTNDTGNYEIDEKIEERDLIFYKSVENETFAEMTPNCFCIFFPSDIHRPAVLSGQSMSIRKVVIKVSVEIL